jgi:S-adenosylmethionine decarboxylase
MFRIVGFPDQRECTASLMKGAVRFTSLNLESEIGKLTSLLDLILIDLYECDHDRLVDAERIRQEMLRAAKVMGAEIVGDSFHTFEPWGVSGTVTIAESHLAIHTWPEYNFAAVTFETCGSRMDHQKACDHLIRYFRSRQPKITHQKRGFMDLGGEELKYKQEFG